MKVTKSLLAVALLGFIISFSSCKKEEADLIVGTWNFSSMEVDVKTNNTFFDELIKTAVASQYGSMTNEATITFNEDGTYNTTSKDEDGKIETNNGKYTLVNNVITLDGEMTMTCNVSKKELKLSLDIKDIFEEGGFGSEDPSISTGGEEGNTSFFQQAPALDGGIDMGDLTDLSIEKLVITLVLKKA